MMKINLSFAIALFLFSFVSCSKDDPESTKEIKTNNPLITQLDKRINEIIAPYAKLSSTASVSVGIFKDNQTIFYGYGETKKGNGKIPDSETIFEIGSITKTFTALLMIDYLQSNSLSIESPINIFLPSDIPLLQHNGNQIRIKHLLNHTSGLPRLPDDLEIGMDPTNPYKHYDSTKVFNFIRNFNLQTDPGQVWEYSNLGAGLSGIILERQNHKNYEQLLIENICNPLGLSKTKITLNADDSSNYAVGYNSFGRQVPYWDDMNAFKGAGAIKSNAKDMIAYGKNILNSQSSTLSSQIESCLNITYENSDLKMASGWIYQTIENNEVILHDGGTAGFNSLIVICKNKNVVLVLLFNNASSSFGLNYVNQIVLEVLK